MKFSPRRRASEFAARLEDILLLLDADALAPKAGVELVASFFRTDEYVFESVDDSSGHVGDVFRFDAVDRFADFAKRCKDHEWLVTLLFDLLAEDSYGVRFHLLEHAADYLAPESLRALVNRFWEAADAPSDVPVEHNWERRHWLLLVETAAKQLKDPELFEKARRLYAPDLGVAACVDIARIYAASGQAQVALEWLNLVDRDERFMTYEREQLLMEVMRDLGLHDELEKLVRQRFRHSRNVSSLSDLLDVVGQDQRENIISEATAEILQADDFSLSDAAFLAECGRTEDAAGYIVRHQRALNGDSWSTLLSLAERMNAEGHALAATVLYRALVDSVLERANSRAYGHAARHLHLLDGLAERVDDCTGVIPHSEYLDSLRTQHGRKTSNRTAPPGSRSAITALETGCPLLQLIVQEGKRGVFERPVGKAQRRDAGRRASPAPLHVSLPPIRPNRIPTRYRDAVPEVDYYRYPLDGGDLLLGKALRRFRIHGIGHPAVRNQRDRLAQCRRRPLLFLK